MGPSFSPLDEELGLLPGTLSPTLQEDLTRLGTWLPFARAADELAYFRQVPSSETTARRLTERMGAVAVAVQEAEVARIAREHPEPPVGPAVQQLSADGAFVPLLTGQWAEVKTLAIGTVGPTPSGTASVPGPREPRATELSYFSRMMAAEPFTELASGEAFARGTERAGVVVAVMDGAPWLQGLVDLQRPDAVRILDFMHAVGYLADAAQATFGANTPGTQAWVAAQRHTLAHAADGAEQVLRAVQHLPVAAAPDPIQATAQQAITLGYLGKRIEQMRYSRWMALGYPIGSGAVESANKLVVEARLKGSGMHWAAAHVDPLLALRTTVCSDRWATTWPRLATERRAQDARRQAARRQHRQDATAAAMGPHSAEPVPSPASAPAQRARPNAVISRADLPRRAKTIINGRPTASHPWRLHPLHLGHRPPPPSNLHPKS